MNLKRLLAMERKNISLPHICTQSTLCGHRSTEHNTPITCIHQRYFLRHSCTQGFHRHTRDSKHSEGHPKWRQSKLRLAWTAVTRNSSVNKNSCEHACHLHRPRQFQACMSAARHVVQGTHILSDRLHTPSHALRNIPMFQIPTNLCTVTDSYSSTNVNLFPHRLSNKPPHTSLNNLSTPAGIPGHNPCRHREMGQLPSQMQISCRHRNICLPDRCQEPQTSLGKVCLAVRNSPLLFEVQLLHLLGILCLQKLFPFLHPSFPLNHCSKKNNTAELIA